MAWAPCRDLAIGHDATASVADNGAALSMACGPWPMAMRFGLPPGQSPALTI